MKLIPILFSAPMVRALLDGRKTQTRREVKRPGFGKSESALEHGDVIRLAGEINRLENPRGRNKAASGQLNARAFYPYGQPGELLWVRERFQIGFRGEVRYFADDHPPATSAAAMWKPSLHMPRALCRLVLRRVGDVRVERLLTISDADARAEGVEATGFEDGVGDGLPDGSITAHQAAYFVLWDEINGPQSAGLNPWVWVIPFEVAANTHAQAQKLIRGVA